jgi:putative transposase
LVSPLKRSWAPRGHTPTIRTSIEHNERLNLIGALCVTAGQRRIRLHLHSHTKSVSGEQVILFLVYLLRVIQGPIILIWDQHPIHNRIKVRLFLEHHPRIHVYPFPTAAPELNPTEFVWTQVSEHTASTAPHNGSELRANVMAGIARARTARRLWGCIFASELPWKRKRGGH